jgi:hypothetical protein
MTVLSYDAGLNTIYDLIEQTKVMINTIEKTRWGESAH